MKTGFISTIQQTLTQEAACVLNRSIAEAGRRNHGQTTPLHVAATLLDSPTGLLRQACMTSHPNSSHPLQCRALDLCFRVALERLPSAGQKVSDTPLSNALTAALKRAQAHQRRGCPENQQQPLLAIKVELEQLIISILDDPSVSKVMREARFSSPAVKAVIEQSIGNRFRPPPPPFVPGPSPAARNQNLYISPRLQQGRKNSWQSGEHRSDETRKVIEIMMRRKKRNAILVGESEPAAVVKEVLRRIENGETGEGLLKNAEVIRLENQIPGKINELGGLIESRIGNSNNRGIVLDLGDLKWLVEQPVSEIARATVAEMGKILSLVEDDGGGGGGGIWLIGTASCETYLRCQVYHTSMEIDWDLQAVPITSRSPLSGIIPMSGTNGSIHNPYVNPLITLKSSPPMAPVNTRARCCPICTNNYEQDLAKLVVVSSETKTESKRPPLLPRWLQNAKTDSHQMEDDRSKIFKTESQEQELHKKWIDTCFLIHPNFHQTPRLENTIVLHQNPQPRLQTLQLSTNPEAPASPVRTDLVLGREKPNRDCIKDLLGCVSKGEDTETFKKLLKGLIEKSWWQKEAASALATAVTRIRGGGLTKGDVWLLFAGPDRVSKKKMALVLAQQTYGADPITIGLGSNRGDIDVRYRGKTSLDRIVDAVRRNPFAVIVLDDIDEADSLIRGSIKLAMEKGRLTDSHGREISLGNIIFIMMAKPDNMEDSNETKYAFSDSNWRMKVSVQERCLKRRANWLDDAEEDRTKMQRKGLSLDLNLLLGNDYEEMQSTMTTVPHELAIHVDDTIVFKPVNFGEFRLEIENRIKESFMVIIGKEHTIELEGAAVEKVVGETWLGNLSLDDWIEKVVSPIFGQLRSHLSGKTMVARLMLEDGSDHGCENGQVRLVVEGRT